MIGDHVVFTDELRVKHSALVTYEHNGGDAEKYPLGVVTINLVYVSGDERANDQYGRQIVHKSSVAGSANEAVKLAGGYFYKLP